LTAIAELGYFDPLFRRISLSPARPAQFSLAMPDTTDPKPATFEAALAELETIVATMEGGQLPLAEALAAYKRGAELLQYCQAALKDAQQQVQVLERGVLKVFTPDVLDVSVPGSIDEP
jgi:exodeoxyribonuclease VII small subunit